MSDSIYHMTLKCFCKHFFGLKAFRFCHKYARLWASFHNVTCMRNGVISLPDAMSSDKYCKLLMVLIIGLYIFL